MPIIKHLKKIKEKIIKWSEMQQKQERVENSNSKVKQNTLYTSPAGDFLEFPYGKQFGNVLHKTSSVGE